MEQADQPFRACFEILLELQLLATPSVAGLAFGRVADMKAREPAWTGSLSVTYQAGLFCLQKRTIGLLLDNCSNLPVQ